MQIEKTALFILAHTDDEILALHLIRHEFSRYVFVYLTNGTPKDVRFTSQIRNNENLRALKMLDINFELHHFGTQHKINDGQLAREFTEIEFSKLLQLVNNLHVNLLISTDFEGGHQDHDAAYLIAAKIGKKLQLPLVAFPAYRASGKYLPSFRVMHPKNLKHTKLRMHSMENRWELTTLALSLMREYKTQFKTWVGLGIPVLKNYALSTLFSIEAEVEVMDAKYSTRPYFEIRKREKAIEVLRFIEVLNKIT